MEWTRKNVLLRIYNDLKKWWKEIFLHSRKWKKKNTVFITRVRFRKETITKRKRMTDPERLESNNVLMSQMNE